MASSHQDAHPYGRSSEEVRRSRERRRRTQRLRLTQLVVFSLLIVMLAAIGAYALRELRSPAPSTAPSPAAGASQEAAPGPGCPEPGSIPLPPTEVGVTVLNGTERSGLAGGTAEALADRGFTVVDTGNTDPVPQIAVVVHGPEGYLAAMSVRAQIGEVELQQDDRQGAGVELRLGEGFAGLAPPEVAEAALQQPVPAPAGC